jgi:CRP/FNR family transcriptional regulator, nitrogen fixation regulation protein
MLRLRGHTETGLKASPGINLKFRKGEIVYLQGDAATDWFQVISGTVRTCLLYNDGHRQLTGFFYPGDVFGVDNGQYSSSAEAVTPLVLRRCYKDTSGEVQANESLPVQGALRSALSNAQACISLLGRRTAAQRLAAFLISTSERFAAGKPFALPMSRSDIADHLGLTIHTVSRTLSEFIRRGFICLNGPQSITIADYCGLRQLADCDDELSNHIRIVQRHNSARSADLTANFGN